MTPKKYNKFNLRCIIYSVGLVLILFVVVPAFQQWDARRMTGMYEVGKQAGYQACLNRPIREQMITIQTQLGLKKIDGKIGPETTPAVNNQVKKEEEALCNQYAVECFEGEPK